MKTRPIKAPDRDRIHEILKAVGNFNEMEIIVAMELVDDAIKNNSSGDYIACVLEDDRGTLQGYACYGLTPMTEGTFDFYWLAVNPLCQGMGYGKKLVNCVEQNIKAMGGRLLVLETSSQDSYKKTTRFYEGCGYKLIAAIKDFYRPNDDKLIYVKYLQAE